MFKVIALLFTFLAISSAASLVFVEGDASFYPANWRSVLEPVYTTSSYTFAICDPALLSTEYSITVLDAEFEDLGDYRLVFLKENTGLESAARLGQILFEKNALVLIKLNGKFQEGSVFPGIHFIQPLNRMNPPRLLFDSRSHRGFDDYVADIVADVSEDTIQAFTQHLEDFETRYSSTDNFDTSCNWVEEKFISYGYVAEQQHFSTLGYDCQNVIAEKPGTEDPTMIYIICGHLDSTSPYPSTNAPGADDNASGSSAVLEAARIFSAFDFKYTVRFICFGGEEQGLYGSRYYAELAAAQSENIIGVVNLDMIYYGPSGQDVLWVPYDTQSTGLALAFDAISDTYVPALTVDIQYAPGSTYSDHSSFWNEGYAALLGIEQEVWTNPYYHQTSDILANYLVYFPFGTNCVKAALAVVAYLAEPLGYTGIESGQDGVSPAELTIGITPNPAGNIATLVFSRDISSTSEISIFDISGRIIESALPGSGAATGSYVLNTEELPAGVFIVRIRDENTEASARLVIVR
ncbi:MAG: M28 family peptidase [Candidatus Fermentibacteraceae bacterium]|nr:M28 family peptidase [Candidatus Fermentibacteraceae bacterium]